MASVLRTGVSKLRFGTTGLCKVTSSSKLPFIQVSCISTREVRQRRPPRLPPFPYETKKFAVWHQLFDDTIERFDDNTKYIVVEGPPALGKGELCKKLAEELDMLYVPQSYLEDFYVRFFDFDLRTLDDKLPETCKTCDIETFLKNPNPRNTINSQLLFFRLKFQKSLQILTHILSTGQGVVTERCVWSDACFAEALHSNGFLTNKAMEMYNSVLPETLHMLMRPHLVIYLDAPVKTVMEKIKKRNNPAEVNSKVMSEKFLTDLEHNYKYKYLKKMSEHALMLIYDYSTGGDFEVIVEDVEALDFDNVKDNKKFSDWDIKLNTRWTEKRRFYCEDEARLLLYCTPEDEIAEEYRISAHDCQTHHDVLKEYAPRQVWDSFYEPDLEKEFEKKFLR